MRNAKQFTRLKAFVNVLRTRNDFVHTDSGSRRVVKTRCWIWTLCVALGSLVSMAHALDKISELSDPQTQRLSVVFDFDTDSCYPSSAISTAGEVNGGMSVTQIDTSYTKGCREPAQLDNSNTYHRRAVISKNGTVYEVRMYALYFMKDKDLPLNQIEGLGGHRHDWEFALVWTTNGTLTHASFSAHGKVTTKAANDLYFDGWCPECTKIVYHKDGGSTHSMRFAGKDEPPENHLHRWMTPTVVDWHRLPALIRSTLNTYDFGHANCSVNDNNFPSEISKSPPTGYPGGDEWKAAARINPFIHIEEERIVK